MSRENIEILQRMFEAWNSGDCDALVEFYDPEVEFNPGLLPPGEETRYIGREGVNEWIRNVNDAWVAVTAGRRRDLRLGATGSSPSIAGTFGGGTGSRSRRSSRPSSPSGTVS